MSIQKVLHELWSYFWGFFFFYLLCASFFPVTRLYTYLREIIYIKLHERYISTPKGRMADMALNVAIAIISIGILAGILYIFFVFVDSHQKNR